MGAGASTTSFESLTAISKEDLNANDVHSKEEAEKKIAEIRNILASYPDEGKNGEAKEWKSKKEEEFSFDDYMAVRDDMLQTALATGPKRCHVLDFNDVYEKMLSEQDRKKTLFICDQTGADVVGRFMVHKEPFMFEAKKLVGMSINGRSEEIPAELNSMLRKTLRSPSPRLILHMANSCPTFKGKYCTEGYFPENLFSTEWVKNELWNTVSTARSTENPAGLFSSAELEEAKKDIMFEDYVKKFELVLVSNMEVDSDDEYKEFFENQLPHFENLELLIVMSAEKYDAFIESASFVSAADATSTSSTATTS
eukprot:g2079.t1